MANTEDKTPYVTITYGMRGWFAVMRAWYEQDQMWDNVTSGIGSYEDPEGARQEAKTWAAADGVRYVHG